MCLLYVYSTVASLERSLSEANKACVELKQSAEDERTRASDCEAQVTRLSAELESLHESLNRKVILSCDLTTQTKDCFGKFGTVRTMYLIYCCHRNLTLNTTL